MGVPLHSGLSAIHKPKQKPTQAPTAWNERKYSMNNTSRTNIQILTARRCPAILLAILLAAAAAVPARAQSTNAASVRTEYITGSSAVATFSVLDPDGCVWTDVFVSGSQGTIFDPVTKRTSTKNATVLISIYDVCTGTLGNSITGYVLDDTNMTFEIDPKLGTASLVAIIPTCDLVATSCFDVLVAVNWWATNSPTHEVVGLQQHAPGYLLTIKVNGNLQGAIASGSVSYGGYNFPARDWITNSPVAIADFAQMDSASQREHTVENHAEAVQP
jgi:hypothetical protein